MNTHRLQNMFWGVAGALDWQQKRVDPEVRDLSIYQRVAEFVDGVPLDEENWHSGMVKINKFDNNNFWRYKKNYHDDCIRDDETADVVYLRSGDKEKAFGVITNRRANYYTLGKEECVEDSENLPAPEHSDSTEIGFTNSLQNYGSVSPSNFNNRLRLRNMKLAKEYKIKYYSPYDLVNSIKEETRWGPKLTLEFPDMDTLNIILFEAFRMGESFKSMQTDTTNSKDPITKTPHKEKKDKVKIYPNPNDGNFVVFIESISTIKAIQITNNLGKIVDKKSKVVNENQYNKSNFNSGIYFVEVVYENMVVRKKIVVN